MSTLLTLWSMQIHHKKNTLFKELSKLSKELKQLGIEECRY